MHRIFRVVGFSAMLVAVVAGTRAEACINDRETIRTERGFQSEYEFKSNFRELNPSFDSSPGGEIVTQSSPSPGTWAFASGLGLMLAATGISLLNFAKRS